jgi:hypothetical protein
MYPFAEQILAFKAGDKNRRIGGLILEVKGDFCGKVRDILTRHGRAEDYIEISLESEYRYNPLHNDLDAYALAYNIASLLNNLFGRGKEPFWQQAYTNLVKFIILLHKVAFDYVTLFDVYECAINPDLLESKIKEAERRLIEADSVLLWEEEYLKYPKDLEPFHFRLDTESKRYRASLTPGLAAVLKANAVQWEAENASRKNPVPAQKKAQLEAVKRWLFHDWRRIEPKLRTSIVEGISVFLSLFDDNPDVKRTFCPPAECYDPHANCDFKFGKPLPSFSWLIDSGAVCGLNFPIGMNPGLAKAVGVMMKLDFERAVLNRVPAMEKNPESYFRQVLFLCDEYQHFATVGESEPTGDEKTSLLNVLGKLIPSDERILLIEDTSEIHMGQDNLVRFEARQPQNGLPAVTIRDLLKASLRHRPDRLILGEIRGGEAFDLLQLLNTGHSGSLSTVHASSARQGLARFTSCVLQSGVDIPYRAVKTNVGDSVNVVVHLERRPGRRFVSEVVEIHGYDPDRDEYNYGFIFDCHKEFV